MSNNRKEIKKDNAVLANIMKETMNEPADSPLIALHRDTNVFLANRMAALVKQNNYQPFCSLFDIGEVLATILCDVVNDANLDGISNDDIKASFVAAYDARFQMWNEIKSQETSEQTSGESVETTDATDEPLVTVDNDTQVE